jgi:hypothetical protein
MGGIYMGFSQKPYWKLFANINKDGFFSYALSAKAYVDCERDVASTSQHS